jgi:hypothetical protein
MRKHHNQLFSPEKNFELPSYAQRIRVVPVTSRPDVRMSGRTSDVKPGVRQDEIDDRIDNRIDDGG